MSLRAWIGVAAIGAALATGGAARAEDDVAARGVPSMRVFGDKDGIPQSSILAIAAEPGGRIWIGTQDGPAFYDGHTWTLLPLPASAESPTIQAIVAASDGAVWFGTQGGGVWRRAGERWTHWGKREGLPGDDVTALVDAFGAMWAGTTNGLARLDDERWAAVDLSPAGMPGTRVYTLRAGALPSSGEPTLWVGGEAGLAHCEGTRCAPFRSKKDGLPGDAVRAVLETQGALWIGTDEGLVRLQGGRLDVFDAAHGALPMDEVWALAETVSGSGTRTLWIGTYGGGLARMVDDHFTSIRSSSSELPIDYVASLAATDGALGRRMLLVGTDGGGLATLRHDAWDGLAPRTSGLPGTGTFGVYETPGSMWFATDGGIGVWTAGAWKILGVKDKSLPTDYTLAIGEWPRDPGAVWIGTYGGLARWVNGAVTDVFTTKTSPLPGNRVHFLHASKDGDALFIGTNAGAAIRREGGWEAYTHANSPVGGDVRGVVDTEGPGGVRSTWFGTDSGLARLSEGRFTLYDTGTSPLPNREIISLAEIQHVLWIGTDGGVARYDLTTDKWLSGFDAATRPPLPDLTIYEILEDARHRVYVFTNRGVTRLTPRTPAPSDPAEFSVYTFTTDDGLPSNECNSGGGFVDSRGRIWAGTIAGAAVFDPGEEVEDTEKKTLVLAPARLGDGTRTISPGASLPWDENTLEFQYALMSPFRERDIRFRTQLVGFERQPSAWTTDGKAKYTNLSEGSYTFRVWGRDYAGNQSGPVEIAFRVRPAPWRTWWAWLSYALAVVAVGYAGHRFRLRALRKRTRELEARVTERTAELDAKVAELAAKNQELEESYQRADMIFSALADALPGTVLDGKYRLDEKIGTGGFGAVFHATHLALGRAVAVKVFRPTQGNDSPQALERFRAEGASACRVNHPNAVQIFDSGISEEGIAYLVMELLDGRSLAQEIDEGRTISLRRCVRILEQICDVLTEAHVRGILHRDVKPDNVFLHRMPNGEEQVKVVDFGIAKLMGFDLARPDLTGTGGFIGTPSYMAPERFGVGPYDERSDIYSVGVTLYEMVAGRLPFPLEDCPIFDVVLRQLTMAPPDVAELAPLLPARAAAIVMRCLEKNASKRPTLGALKNEFASAVAELPDEAQDASAMAPPRIKSMRPLADQLAATISADAPTKQRFISSKPPPAPPPSSKRAPRA